MKDGWNGNTHQRDEFAEEIYSDMDEYLSVLEEYTNLAKLAIANHPDSDYEINGEFQATQRYPVATDAVLRSLAEPMGNLLTKFDRALEIAEGNIDERSMVGKRLEYYRTEMENLEDQIEKLSDEWRQIQDTSALDHKQG